MMKRNKRKKARICLWCLNKFCHNQLKISDLNLKHLILKILLCIMFSSFVNHLLYSTGGMLLFSSSAIVYICQLLQDGWHSSDSIIADTVFSAYQMILCSLHIRLLSLSLVLLVLIFSAQF